MNAATESDHKLSLNDQLREKFQLKAEPFGAAAHLFFHGAQRQHNLETLRHLVSYGDMVLLLTGGAGSGKTTLIAELGKQLVGGVRLLNLLPSLIASPRKLAFELCKKLDIQQIDGEPVSRCMERVLETCAHKSASGERLLLVVDDAHKVNKDSFKLLLSTFRGLSGDSGICLLISGRQEVLQSITHDGVDPATCSWMHQIYLKPLSQDEAEAYVGLRLLSAGAKANPEFSEAQKKALHALGKGCPGRINRIASGVLLDSFEVERPNKKTPKGLSWLLVGIVASLLLSFGVIGYQYDLFLSPSDVSSAFESDQFLASGENITSSELPSETLIKNSVGGQGGNLNSKAEIIERIEQAEQQARLLNESPMDVPEPKVASLKADESAIEQGFESKGADIKAPSQPENAVSEAVYSPDGVIQPTIASDRFVENTAKNDLAMKVQAETKGEEKASGVSGYKKEQPSKSLSEGNNSSDKHSGFRDRAWLAAQKKGSYTIQVLGSRSEQTAIQYIDDEKASGELIYITSTYKEKPWFVVILSVYPNKVMAQEKMKNLPSSIKKQKPWIRSLKGL